ncbi:hypothetical protein FBULB1_11996 [Fusarium bulbicola]|nr:hypothetical protein FBULB1_11996 [Fusarium bulbicola]
MEQMNNRESSLLIKSKPIDGTSWSTTDRLQLLAYLEWCVQYCVNFQVTAPGYLEKATGKHFSKERIRQKLYKEWQTYGTCDKFNDLFDLGTSGLLTLVDDEQQYFHQIVTGIDPAEGAHCTPGRSLGLAAPSGTLSEPHSICSIGTTKDPDELSTPEASDSDVVPGRPRKKRKAKLSVGPTRQTSNNYLGENKPESDDSTGSAQSEDESVLISIASPELSDVEFHLAPVIPDSPKDDVTIIPRAQSTSTTKARLRQSEADLLKQKIYVITLENRISELERINHSKHCICLTSSAQINYGEETRIQDFIFSSKNSPSGEEPLATGYENLEANRLRFLNTSLRAEYENLHSNIRDTSSTICHSSLAETLPEQRTDFSDLANNWARRIGGKDLGSLLNHCETAQIPKKAILISLLAAGIFDLVLEKVFPTFLAADPSLLDQYRKHIEILCTLFDGEKMEVVKSQAGDSLSLGQEVQICLLPALFAIPEAADEVGVEEEASLSASSRKAFAEVADEDIESLVLLEKAVVFL